VSWHSLSRLKWISSSARKQIPDNALQESGDTGIRVRGFRPLAHALNLATRCLAHGVKPLYRGQRQLDESRLAGAW